MTHHVEFQKTDRATSEQSVQIQLGDLPFLHQTSVVNIQGIGSLVEPRLERKSGQISPAIMAKVEDALRLALEL